MSLRQFHRQQSALISIDLDGIENESELGTVTFPTSSSSCDKRINVTSAVDIDSASRGCVCQGNVTCPRQRDHRKPTSLSVL